MKNTILPIFGQLFNSIQWIFLFLFLFLFTGCSQEDITHKDLNQLLIILLGFLLVFIIYISRRLFQARTILKEKENAHIINLSNEENSYRKDIVTIGPVTIYSTDQQPYLPPDASDFRINKEHWFIQPVEMIRIGYLSLGQLLKGKISLIKKPNQIVDYPKDNLPQKRF